ncbi:MAG: DUF6404 family protein [Planctomycetes bacterium]|nr:DUF6404 family protein [Planctomycetota bacterium]
MPFRREFLGVYVHEMRDRGADPLSAAPPLFRLLWRCGSEVPPPHYLSFRSMVLLVGGLFGGCMALPVVGLHLLVGLPLLPGLLLALAGGLLFGCTMAFHYRSEALRLRLPSLEEFLEHGHFPEDPAPAAPRTRRSPRLRLP